MKKVLFIAIVTILVTHTHSAYAYFYSRTPATADGSEINQDTLEIVFQISESEATTLGWQGNSFVCAAITDPLHDINPGDCEYLIFDTDITFIINLINGGQYDSIYICDQNKVSFDDDDVCGVNGFFIDQEFNEFNLFTVSISDNQTWGSNNGFWGDTTPSVIVSDMQASVSETGVNIYPLITFVGIPVAFLIALYLIWLINKTLTPVKKSDENVINPHGENFIYHSASDLEDKREYGQVKRKRGRPRKNPI